MPEHGGEFVAADIGGDVLTRARADWYYRSFPHGPHHAPRCLEVLASLGALYNLDVTGKARLDGGFRTCGDGVEVHLRPGYELASFDGDGLTALVVAAHRLRCRVAVRCRGQHLIITVHPRKAEGSLYERHPGLGDLFGGAW